MKYGALIAPAVVAAACGGSSPDPDVPHHSEREGGARAASFSDRAEAFQEAEHAFRPGLAVTLGHHEHAGVLPDRSDDAVQEEIARLEAARDAFSSFEREALSPTQRAEREAILVRAARGLFELEVLRAHARDPRRAVHALDVSYYADVPYAPAGERAEAVMAICDGAESFLDAAVARISSDAPRPWLRAAQVDAEASIAYLDDRVATAFADAPAGLEDSLAACKGALASFRDALGARLSEAPPTFELGEDGLRRRFAAEGIDVELSTIRGAAQAALERHRAALAEAAAEIDSGASVAEIVGFERSNRPAADEVYAIAEGHDMEVRALVEQTEAARVPSDLEIQALPAPPTLRDRKLVSRSPAARAEEPWPAALYVSPPDPSWPQAERDGYVLSIGDLLVAAAREGSAGRALHAAASARNQSDILATLCPETTRGGFAHYAESMVWRAGLASGEPRVHVMLRSSAILRSLRVLTALDLHTGAMTAPEAAERLQAEAFLDPATARREARRATYDVTYGSQALGRLAIEAMASEWRSAAGPAADSDFHDELLAHGCAPPAAIRDALLGPDAGPILGDL